MQRVVESVCAIFFIQLNYGNANKRTRMTNAVPLIYSNVARARSGVWQK